MPPKRDPRRDQAAVIYKERNGDIDLVTIAEQLGVSPGTVRGWKSKDKDAWSIGTERGSERSKQKTPPAEKSLDQIISDAVEKNENLTQPQKDFCVYFTRNRNATQAYLKAYNCSYNAAHSHGWELLRKVAVKRELQALQQIKNAALGGLCGDDVVELHMRIAFACMEDFTEWDPGCVRLNDSSQVDSQLISEITETREGVKIKLRNQDTSMRFLERYFSLNPMDRHRQEYENKKLELDLIRIEADQPDDADDGSAGGSNFDEALAAATKAAWGSDSESHPPDDSE